MSIGDRARRIDALSALAVGVGTFIPAGSQRMGPVNPVSTPAARVGVYPYYRRTTQRMKGLGAAGASEITVQAARALDVQLFLHGCDGCNHFKSQLRQLTFAFKAACLTDPAIAPSVTLNMATPLAMTGFGPGTDAALSLVLDVYRTYMGQPCTDNDGNCLPPTGLPTPVIPSGLQSIAAQVVQQIRGLISQHTALPASDQLVAQGGVVASLIAFFAGLINQIGFEAQKVSLPGGGPGPTIEEKKTTTVTTTAPADDKVKKVITWGLIGSAVAGAGYLVYHLAKKE